MNLVGCIGLSSKVVQSVVLHVRLIRLHMENFRHRVEANLKLKE